MTIAVSRKQVADLARNLDVPGKSYNQKLEIIAKGFGFPNQAAMMAVLNKAPERARFSLSGTVSDHMDPVFCSFGPEDAPVQDPVPFVIDTSGSGCQVLIGGFEDDYTQKGASCVALERRGNLTRVMIYDACCDSPRVIGIPDDGPMRELPNDWESVDREYLDDDPDDDPEADTKGSFI